MLRHVSPAFAEDPVRILRLARFAARCRDFRVAAETMALCAQMVADGEVDALVPERVWQELSRGLMEPQPVAHVRGAARLRRAGARCCPRSTRLWGVPQRAEHHPEVDTGVHLMMVLDMAARLAAPLPVRFACLGHDLGKGSTPPAAWPRHIAPRGAQRQAGASAVRAPARAGRLPRTRPTWWRANTATSTAAASSAPQRRCACSSAATPCADPSASRQVLLACECDARGRLGQQDAPYPQRDRLATALRVALEVDASAVAAAAAERGATGPAIGDAVRRAREQALAAAL